MNTIPLALAALLIAGCAAGPEPMPADSQVNCRSADAPTGSHLVRRDQCDRRAGATAPAAQGR